MEPLCRDCTDFGRSVKATRFVGKTPVCDEHMARRLGQSFSAKPAEVTEEKSMPKSGRLSESEIESIRKKAAAGASFQEISKEFNVSWATVQYHVGKNGKKPAGGAKAGRASSARTNGNGHAKHAANGDSHFFIELSLGGMDAIWNSLMPEKKAELLRGL
jgi:predicted DNA-binding protein (UPF0251 family)